MKKILIKKENNTITKEIIEYKKREKINLYNISVYNFLNPKNKNYQTKPVIQDMFITLKRDKKEKEIYNLYSKLLRTKTKDELEDIMLEFISIYSNREYITSITETKIKTVKNLYRTQKDDMLNSFVHELVNEYYNIIVKNISTENILKLNEIIDDNTESFLSTININFTEENKKANIDTLSKEALKEAIHKRYEKDKKHLCWGCTINILNCPKLLDVNKHPIQDYEFIKEGEQLYNTNGELEQFIVTKCLKMPKKKTKILKKNTTTTETL